MKEKNHYYLRDTKLKEKGNVLELVQEYALAINLNPIHNPANAKKVRTGPLLGVQGVLREVETEKETLKTFPFFRIFS